MKTNKLFTCLLLIATLISFQSKAQIDPLSSPYYNYGSYTVVADSDMTTSPALLFYHPNVPDTYPVLMFQLGANGFGSSAINRHSYDLYMKHLASYGFTVIIIDDSNAGMPNGTSFSNTWDWFTSNVSITSHWLHNYADPEQVVVGGHSNGGVNACAFIDSDPTTVQGCILLAAYPSPGIFGFGAHDMSTFEGKVLDMAGSEDDGSTYSDFNDGYNSFTSAACKTWVYVDGLDHGGFGDYVNTSQPVGSIGRDAATASVRHYLVSFMLSEFGDDSQSNLSLTQTALQPNSTGEFESDCTGVPVQCGLPYNIGHSLVQFTDPSRGNRQIAAHIYYPAEVNGENVAVGCSGQNDAFPLLIMGHGFVMSYSDYENFQSHLVPQGYIIVMPTTEGGMSPNHGTFGLDLAFLLEKIISEAQNNPSFLLYQQLTNNSALMGHSMGAGAALLAAANNTTVTTIITFAANETTPSCIDTAQYINVPSLVFSGGNDCIALPEENQLPVFCNIGSSEKYFISINGGSHCQFANSSTSCDFGEMTCSPSPAISRDEQHDVTFDFLDLYLAWQLKSDNAAQITFLDSLSSSERITSSTDCNVTWETESPIVREISIYPNPANDYVNIDLAGIQVDRIEVSITDMLGRKVYYSTELASQNPISLNLTPYIQGIYTISVNINGRVVTKRIMKS